MGYAENIHSPCPPTLMENSKWKHTQDLRGGIKGCMGVILFFPFSLFQISCDGLMLLMKNDFS